MSYFRVKEDKTAGYTGFVSASHRWGLPGIDCCPGCRCTWSGGAKNYPSVDLTPVDGLANFEEARAEPIEEYERLCDLVRPLLPRGAQLEPGSAFGPLEGEAEGIFGQFVANYSYLILIRREALEKLQHKPLRGLKGCRMDVRYLESDAPELLELELLPKGLVHPDCLPPDREPPCARCLRQGLSVPKNLLLEAATLPTDLDLFRLEDFPTVVVCTERFVEACTRLDLDGLAFTPLPVR